MKFWDKVWLGENRKAHKKWFSYFIIKGMPFYIGLFLGYVIFGKLPTFWMVISSLIICIFVYLDIRTDVKRGYYDAIHNNYLARREEIMKEWDKEAK